MRAVVGIFVGVAVAAVAGIALSVFGVTGRLPALACLGLGGLAGLLAGWRTVSGPVPRLKFWDYAVLSVFAVAAFRAFFWLYYPDGEEIKVLSPHNLGDLSLHLSLIRYFAAGVHFWPQSPILSGAPLTYPPGADYFNALLAMAGWGVRPGLIFCGFVAALSGAWALWRYGGAFAVAAFLFGGGLAGFAIFRTGEFVEYGKEDVWKNAFLTMLVTQRGFLYALPAGLALLWGWREEFFGGEKRVPFWAQAVLYATMPLFQLHTFLFLSGGLALAAALNPRGWMGPAKLVAVSFPAATAAVLAVTGFFRAKGALRFDPGWAVDGWGFFLEFGVALVIGGFALVLAWRSGEASSRWVAALCAGAALAGFLFPLNDWAWDNTKILVWAWVAAAPVIWKFVIAPLPLAPRAAICALLFFSGAVALAAGLDGRHGYGLVDRKELAAWEKALAAIPPGTVIACEPTYNHPALLLGYPVVCGYEGHLMSHGLDYREKLTALHRVLAKRPGWQNMARSLGASYVAPKTGSPILLPVGSPDGQ